MARLPSRIEADPAELAHILERERQRRRAEEMQDLSRRAGTDPDAYERLKSLVSEHRPAPPATS
jgi:DNA primase